MSRKTLYLIAFFVVLITVFYVALFAGTDFGKRKLPVLGNPGHTVGPFSFVDQAGDTITEKALDGKVSVVEYFFTRCTGICPKMNKNMDLVYEEFKEEPGFQILSYSVDPSHDSVQVLERYAEQFGAKPEVWKFLTGDRAATFDVAVHQYLLNAADSAGVTEDFVHTQMFALVDGDRRIRGFYDGLDPDELKQLRKDIRLLLKPQ